MKVRDERGLIWRNSVDAEMGGESRREKAAWEKSAPIFSGCLEMQSDVYGRVVIICRWRR